MKKYLLALTAIALLSGCTSTATPEERAAFARWAANYNQQQRFERAQSNLQYMQRANQQDMENQLRALENRAQANEDAMWQMQQNQMMNQGY